MATLKLDIATRFQGPAEDMYIIRPGESFSLYRDFIEQNAVFLDFPDIRLDFSNRPSKYNLRKDVVRSMALQGWYRGGKIGTQPSRNPIDYSESVHRRRVGHYVAAIERLYYTLAEGTIIVVPGPGYFSDVLIGELVGPPTTLNKIRIYPGEHLPVRRIKWIGRRAKARFGEKLRERLGKSTPLMAIDRSLRHEILEAAFDQFSIGNQYSSRLVTTQEDFSTLDDYNIQTFINYASGVLVAVGLNRDRNNITIIDALELLQNNRHLIPELKSNINSPGAMRIFHSNVLPITVAVLLAIATSSDAISPDTINVVNTAVDGNDPCALQVQEQAMEAIKMMDVDSWHKVCVQVRDAAKSTGLSTSIKILSNQDRP